MRSLILIALFICCGRNAEPIKSYRSVPYVMGGSQITFSLIGMKTVQTDLLKCVVRFPYRPDPIVLKPSIHRDGLSVICRLPAEIYSGSIDIDLEVTTMSTKAVILSETVTINPSSVAEVKVEENWDTQELSFTWDPEYFKQFFNPGATIMIQATLYVSDSNEPVFTTSGIVILTGANGGTAKVSITNVDKNKISNIMRPYYYTLRPVGTQSNVFLSSALFMSTHA